MLFRYLGQNINIGRVVGSNVHTRMIVVENATAFSLLDLFSEPITNREDSAVVICKENNTNVIAFAYNIYTDQYSETSYTTWIKVATSGTTISDNDAPPTNYGLFNGWTIVGHFDIDDFLDFTTFAANSIMFYQLDTGLYPYWNGANTFTADDILQGGMNFMLVLPPGIEESHDGTSGYQGPTPILTHEGATTNYIDSNTYTYPSYTFQRIYGLDAIYIYNPLYINEAVEIKGFEEDTATPGWGYDTAYGYEGGNVGFSSPLGLSAIDTGMLTLFSPEPSQVRDLADYLWTSDFVTNLKKLWADPMDAIISFGILPCDLSSIKENTASNIMVGNVDTEVDAYRLTSQHYVKEFGPVHVKEQWGSALDFEPFCRAQLYLPFIGFVPLRVNDIMDADVRIQYSVDCLSGDCVAQVKVTKDVAYNPSLDSVIYEFQGNCLIRLPLSSRDFSTFYKNLVSGGFNMIGSAVGGNIGGAVAGGSLSALNSFMDGPDIQRSGAYGGSSSGMSLRTPYIVLTRAVQHMPDNYSHYVGYPSFITEKLSNCEGYTVIEEIIDNKIVATDTEKREIEALLKKGVILPPTS